MRLRDALKKSTGLSRVSKTTDVFTKTGSSDLEADLIYRFEDRIYSHTASSVRIPDPTRRHLVSLPGSTAMAD